MSDEGKAGTEAAESTTTQDAAPVEDRATETQDTTQETQDPQPSAAKERWAQFVPDLAEHYDELSPEAREGILLKRLATQDSQRAAKVDDPETGSTTDGADANPPPPLQAPTLDAGKLLDSAKKLIENGDPQEFVDSLRSQLDGHFQYTQQLAQLALDALKAQDRKFRDLELPNQFRGALAKVRGAAESDIAAARRLLESGEAKTPESALKLAVFNRQEELESARAPSDEAKRKVAAIKGQKRSLDSVTPGSGRTARIPETMDEWREELRREAAAERR